MMRNDGNSEIFIINRDGTNPKRVTKSWSSEASPTWSPTGRKIAFVSDRAGSPQIYTMDLSGKDVKRLTFFGSYNACPSWSPKGIRSRTVAAPTVVSTSLPSTPKELAFEG